MTQSPVRQADEKFCSACGKAINVLAQMCPNCGVPQAYDSVVEARPSVTAAQQESLARLSSERVILGADEQYCSSCGAMVKKLAEVCPTCGVRQHAAPSSRQTSAEPAPLPGSGPRYVPMPGGPAGKNKWLAVVMAVLLGWAGGHKFYLKKYAQGFLYLGFCWTTVPFWISLIEGLVYLFTPSETFERRYPI